jgi:hypothetical protein
MRQSRKANPYFLSFLLQSIMCSLTTGSGIFSCLHVYFPSMQSSVQRHIDRRNGVPNQRPRGRRPKEKTNRPKATPTDLAQAKQKRKENCDTYSTAFAAAQQAVWDQAEALREKFGKHDTNFYFEEIIHRAHLKVAERSMSRWNAFLSLELDRRNKGFLIYFCKFNNVINVIFFNCRASQQCPSFESY